MPRTATRRSVGPLPKTEVRPCTYDQGYVRQDLYICRKCMKENNNKAFGFCVGCRQTCHGDHIREVVELYTKRQFRCDCGNAHSGRKCELFPEKDAKNVENQYSHNFHGKYCRCDRAYDSRLAMAQCAMCEDWLHEKCYELSGGRRGLSASKQNVGNYELICKDCVKTLPVLREYHATLNASCTDAALGKWHSDRTHKACLRPQETKVEKEEAGSVDLLWVPGFRIFLCRCQDCMEIYREAKALYIVDRTDFVMPYVEEALDVSRGVADGSEGDEDEEDEGEDDNDEEGKGESDDEVEVVEDGKDRHAGMEEDDGNWESVEQVEQVDSGADGDRENRSGEDDDWEVKGKEVRRVRGMSSTSVDWIRERIVEQLRKTMEENEGKLPLNEVLSFLASLKGEVFATFSDASSAAGAAALVVDEGRRRD